MKSETCNDNSKYRNLRTRACGQSVVSAYNLLTLRKIQQLYIITYISNEALKHLSFSLDTMSSILNVMEKSSISKVHFPDVVDGKINTEEFLHAVCELVKIIAKFGNLFAPVKYDMNNNFTKLNDKYSLDKEKYTILQDMILLEKEEGKTIIALEALIWLTRALHLILLFLEKIIKDHNAGRETEDLGAFLTEAYKESLEPHHGWMMRQLFGLLSRSILSRSQLLQTLKGDENVTNEILLRDMDIYLKTVRSNVEALQIFYQNNKLEI